MQLAKDHMKSVQKLEKHKQKELKERQETFQSAFDQDVDFYRTHGRLERKLQFFSLPKVIKQNFQARTSLSKAMIALELLMIIFSDWNTIFIMKSIIQPIHKTYA